MPVCFACGPIRATSSRCSGEARTCTGWCSAGTSVNWTGGTVHVAGLHVTVLTTSGTIVAERECNYELPRKHQYPDWPAEPQSRPHTVNWSIRTRSSSTGWRYRQRVLCERRPPPCAWSSTTSCPTAGVVRPPAWWRRRSWRRRSCSRRAGQLTVLGNGSDADQEQPARPFPRALPGPHAAQRERGDLLRTQDDDNDSFLLLRREDSRDGGRRRAWLQLDGDGEPWPSHRQGRRSRIS